jgi:hypothetical protein
LIDYYGLPADFPGLAEAMVQLDIMDRVTALDGSDVNHHVSITAPAAEARQFPDSFVAFLSVSRFFSADSVVLAQARTLCGSGNRGGNQVGEVFHAPLALRYRLEDGGGAPRCG